MQVVRRNATIERPFGPTRRGRAVFMAQNDEDSWQGARRGESSQAQK
jgi:hypothetical protein